jgi:hypothetical protein
VQIATNAQKVKQDIQKDVVKYRTTNYRKAQEMKKEASQKFAELMRSLRRISLLLFQPQK